MDRIYQLKLGKPFSLRDVDRLFYACTYLDSRECFFIEKEKFVSLADKGFVTEYRNAASM